MVSHKLKKVTVELIAQCYFKDGSIFPFHELGNVTIWAIKIHCLEKVTETYCNNDLKTAHILKNLNTERDICLCH